MTRPDLTRPRPTPAPYIHARRFNTRTWVVQAVGRGEGFLWGAALAALDFYSEAHTDGTPPIFYLSDHMLARLRSDLHRMGVRVVLAPGRLR